MSHFAELDKDNKVMRVLVGDNDDPTGDEGYQWLINNLGGTWVKTSYNAATNGFRYNYAGIGFTYDADADAFVPPKPQCGHKELFLNDKFNWNCQGCDLEAKARLDGN
jgi:hypothetical protein